ncbi:lipocalin family protein [Methylocaldum sp. GT1TLB]|jgi:apolipoprotein D and lipocalin family protein|uniref:lipocalin family protein n=1 Tax=Methylocaldum sp. GT1TLB TaxID=3438965 RepID=UPI003DA004EA
MKLLTLLSTLFLAGCAGIPKGVSPVQGFELSRYLGAWYEIARLDHSFERGLTRVTATYGLREDGGIKVVNRGFDSRKQEWREATGKAYFVESPDIGRLKVSFFGPFYGGYNIIDLDKENYSYALVSGPTRSYLWILAREKTLESSVLHHLVTKAEALGFATDRLIYVDHSEK